MDLRSQGHAAAFAALGITKEANVLPALSRGQRMLKGIRGLLRGAKTGPQKAISKLRGRRDPLKLTGAQSRQIENMKVPMSGPTPNPQQMGAQLGWNKSKPLPQPTSSAAFDAKIGPGGVPNKLTQPPASPKSTMAPDLKGPQIVSPQNLDAPPRQPPKAVADAPASAAKSTAEESAKVLQEGEAAAAAPQAGEGMLGKAVRWGLPASAAAYLGYQALKPEEAAPSQYYGGPYTNPYSSYGY